MAMMTERITHSSVTFLHSFFPRDVEGMQPPDTYLIETVEEPLGNLSFLAYRRVSTTITPPAVAASLRKQVVTIDPDELRDALAKVLWLRQRMAKQGGHESVVL
jgi:hypothetical protein